ncbi:MAG: 30S ribosomal protein S21 [Bacilli bacterium]|jgi:small subunit ribosomal protein S21|nr:30S ribosomal protein S21 [Bacilli bacterium]
MTHVPVKEGSKLEPALERYRKNLQRSGTLSIIKERTHYDKPGVRRRKKKRAAIKNSRKRNARRDKR